MVLFPWLLTERERREERRERVGKGLLENLWAPSVGFIKLVKIDSAIFPDSFPIYNFNAFVFHILKYIATLFFLLNLKPFREKNN